MLATLTLAYHWEITLSVISRVIAFLLSPESGDTDGCFIEVMGFQTAISKNHNTVHTVVYPLPLWSVVYPSDLVADVELQLALLQASQETIQPLFAMPGKDQNSKSEIWLLLNEYGFHIIINSKNPKSNHCNLGTICIKLEMLIIIDLQVGISGRTVWCMCLGWRR